MTLVASRVDDLIHTQDGDYACMMFGSSPDLSLEPLWWNQAALRWYGRPFSMMSANDQAFIEQHFPEWGYHNSPLTSPGASYHLHGATDYAGARFAAGLTLQQMIVGRGKCNIAGYPLQMRPYFFEYGTVLGTDNRLSLNNDSSGIPVANQQTGANTSTTSSQSLPADTTVPFTLSNIASTAGFLPATTTTATIAASGAITINVASAANFPTGAVYTVLVDSEQMVVTAGQGTTAWTVTAGNRGVNGTTAAAHSSGAPVTLNQDFLVLLHSSFDRPVRLTFTGVTANTFTGCIRSGASYNLNSLSIPSGTQVWIARPSNFPPSGYNPNGLPTYTGTAAGPGIGVVGYGPTWTCATTNAQSVWISTGWQDCQFYNAFSSGEIDTTRPYTPVKRLLYCTMYSRVGSVPHNVQAVGATAVTAAFVVRGRWVSK